MALSLRLSRLGWSQYVVVEPIQKSQRLCSLSLSLSLSHVQYIHTEAPRSPPNGPTRGVTTFRNPSPSDQCRYEEEYYRKHRTKRFPDLGGADFRISAARADPLGCTSETGTRLGRDPVVFPQQQPAVFPDIAFPVTIFFSGVIIPG